MVDLSSALVKEFAKQALEAQSEKVTPAVQLVGTVSVVGGETYVVIDGSGGNLTPVENTVDYTNGDRVLLTIQNRTATIIGNYTEPSITNALDSVVVEYALSSSESSFIAWPGTKGQWSTTAPEREDGSYMWQRTTSTPVSGTSSFTMTCIQGADGEGEDGVTITISSSNGIIFHDQAISTILTAVVFYGSEVITTETELKELFGNTAVINWYYGDTFVGTGFTYEVVPTTNLTVNIGVRLEI